MLTMFVVVQTAKLPHCFTLPSQQSFFAETRGCPSGRSVPSIQYSNSETSQILFTIYFSTPGVFVLRSSLESVRKGGVPRTQNVSYDELRSKNVNYVDWFECSPPTQTRKSGIA